MLQQPAAAHQSDITPNHGDLDEFRVPSIGSMTKHRILGKPGQNRGSNRTPPLDDNASGQQILQPQGQRFFRLAIGNVTTVLSRLVRFMFLQAAKARITSTAATSAIFSHFREIDVIHFFLPENLLR